MNVALHRPSYLSSTHTNLQDTFWPSRGNDGDKTNCNGAVMPNSITHGNYEVNPWYGVDLGVALLVAGVQLTNRAEMGGW